MIGGECVERGGEGAGTRGKEGDGSGKDEYQSLRSDRRLTGSGQP